jgi:hypothetical protein
VLLTSFPLVPNNLTIVSKNRASRWKWCAHVISEDVATSIVSTIKTQIRDKFWAALKIIAKP